MGCILHQHLYHELLNIYCDCNLEQEIMLEILSWIINSEHISHNRQPASLFSHQINIWSCLWRTTMADEDTNQHNQPCQVADDCGKKKNK